MSDFQVSNVTNSSRNLAQKISGLLNKSKINNSFSLLEQMSLIRDDCGDTFTKLQYFIAGIKSTLTVIPSRFYNPTADTYYGFSDIIHLTDGDETAEFPCAIGRYNNTDYTAYADRYFDENNMSHENIKFLDAVSWSDMPSNGIYALYSLIYMLNKQVIKANYNDSFYSYISHTGTQTLTIPIDGRIVQMRVRFSSVTGTYNNSNYTLYGLSAIDFIRKTADNSEVVANKLSVSTFWNNEGDEAVSNRDSLWRDFDIPYYSKPSPTGKPYKIDLVSLINELQNRAMLQDTIFSIGTGFCNGDFKISTSIKEQVMNVIRIKGYDNVDSLKDFMLQINASSDSIVNLMQVMLVFYTDMNDCSPDANDDGMYKFNSEYVVTRDIQTTITSAISNVATTVLATIASAINPILGALASGIGTIISSIVNAKNQIVESLTYPKVNFDSVLNNFDIPIFQVQYNVDTSKLPDDMQEAGSAITMRLPGCLALMWITEVNSGLSKLCIEGYQDLYQICGSNGVTSGYDTKNRSLFRDYLISNNILAPDYMTVGQAATYIDTWCAFDFNENRPWREQVALLGSSLNVDADNQEAVLNMYYQVIEAWWFIGIISEFTSFSQSSVGMRLNEIFAHSTYFYFYNLTLKLSELMTGGALDDSIWDYQCQHCKLMLNYSQSNTYGFHLERIINSDYYSQYIYVFPDSSASGFKIGKYSEGRPSTIVDLLIAPEQVITSTFRKKLVTGVILAAVSAAAVSVAAFMVRRYVKQKSTNLAQRSLADRNALSAISPEDSVAWSRQYKEYRRSMFRYSLYSTLTGSNGLAVSGSVNPNWNFQAANDSSGLFDSTARIFENAATVVHSCDSIIQDTTSMGRSLGVVDSKIDTSIDKDDTIIELIRGPITSQRK